MTRPRTPFEDAAPSRQIAERLVQRSPQDLVFVMRFLGESQLLLYDHFRRFVAEELAQRGATRDRHPLLQLFIDAHANELREFVFTGVSLARQFRLPEIETLTGDAETMMRIEIWDALAGHVEMAQWRFLQQADGLPAQLDQMEAARAAGNGPR